jgi:hypothetical protein
MAKIPNIVGVAQKYVGKQEIAGNMGFKDADFQKRMEAVGFLKGQAWCSYFTELVWKEAYNIGTPESIAILKKLDKLFSASATATFKNFELDGTFKVGQVPIPGAIVIFRHGVGWQGHAGIVTAYANGDKVFYTVEGNTNAQGGREGIEVAQKSRKLGLPLNKNGLNIVGFIYPNAI